MTNTEREKFLIGKVLINPELFIKDEDRLMKIKLNEPNYSFLWEAIKKVHKSGTKIDMVTIGKEIGMDKNSLSVLFDCEAYGYTSFDFNSLIEDLSYRSKYQTMGNLLLNINNLMQKNEPLDTISDELKKGIEIIQTDESANDENIGGQLKDYYTTLTTRMSTDGITGVTTGYSCLDNFTNGLQPTDLTIIGAASSMGKTSFALNVAYNAVRAKHPVAVFSYEMSAPQLLQRIISIESGVSLRELNQGAIDKEQLQLINKAIGVIEDLPLKIDDCKRTSLSYLTAKIRKYAINDNVQVVFIDYLQLVSVQGKKNGTREQEVSMVARTLKNLAKELNISVIALSQLNRGVSFRGNPKPTMSDLRESGEIEQAADIVCLLFRPEYYNIPSLEDGTDAAGLAQIIFAKGRNIGVGEINMSFDSSRTKFTSLI
jgi:replicative DNA helicase